MVSVYPRPIVEVQPVGSSSWLDVTRDVILGSLACKSGILARGPLDRVAGTGVLKFALRNDRWNASRVENLYTPGHAAALIGWRPGVKVRLRFELEGRYWYKFYGTIPPGGIAIDREAGRVSVEVRDFMEQAAIHEIQLPTLEQNKRMDEIIPLIVAGMPVQPLAVDYKTGTETFSSAFDTVRQETRAKTEMAKVALSEVGYIYIAHRPDAPEVLVAESRYTRNDKYGLDTFGVETSGILLTEGAESLLSEDGEELEYVSTEQVDALFSTAEFDISLVSSEVYNRVRTRAYPRKVDAAAVILFELDRPVEIAAGETRLLWAQYRDPEARASATSGIDMVAPLSGTDYTANAQADGGGADRTADLSVTADYGTSGVAYALENVGITALYVTKLQARGKGVYTYNSVDFVSEDTTSMAVHGMRLLDVDMRYQDNPLQAEAAATALLQKYSEANTLIERAWFCANRSDLSARAFLELDAGSKIEIEDVSGGMGGQYFVNGWEFGMQDNLINATWYLKLAADESFTAWYLEQVGAGELGQTTILGF